MTERSYPFVKESGSSTVAGTTSDAEFSAMFRNAFADGVVGVTTDSRLKPYGNSTGLKVIVPGGSSFVRGHFYNNTEAVTLVIQGGGSSPRIDSVILKLGYGGVNNIHLEIKAGTPAANPSPVALTKTETGTYELLLGTVYVAAGASTITSANVTDRRVFTGINPANIGAALAAHSHTLGDLGGVLPVTKGGTGSSSSSGFGGLRNLGTQAGTVVWSGDISPAAIRQVPFSFVEEFQWTPNVVASQRIGYRDTQVWASDVTRSGFIMNFANNAPSSRGNFSAAFVAMLS